MKSNIDNVKRTWCPSIYVSWEHNFQLYSETSTWNQVNEFIHSMRFQPSLAVGRRNAVASSKFVTVLVQFIDWRITRHHWNPFLVSTYALSYSLQLPNQHCRICSGAEAHDGRQNNRVNLNSYFIQWWLLWCSNRHSPRSAVLTATLLWLVLQHLAQS